MIAIIFICSTIFVYDLMRKGHVDASDFFVVPVVVAGVAYLVGLGFQKIELIVITASGDQYILAKVDHKDISLEDVHRWCGMISATGVDWKR
ncbi:MAG: hypothetical protein HYX92_09000 [Chloroflexi bacterium]|nr:hypothetical protein [Chloroflexota bacterium]